VGLIEAPSHHPQLDSQVCCEDELIVICKPDHVFAKQASLKPEMLVMEPLVSREIGSGTREVMDDYFRRAGIVVEDLNIVMELGSPEAIKGAVETGMGVAIMSSATVSKETRLGDLAAVRLEPRLIRPLSLVFAHGKFRSRLLQTFLDFVMESFSKRPHI
jgi:DNA-binding transcriptional LysR family regulator